MNSSPSNSFPPHILPNLPDGKTKLYAVIGNPITHSLSPRMHTVAFRSLGINAVYLGFNLDEVGNDLRTAFGKIGLSGFNITAPFKTDVIKWLNDVDPLAAKIESVNTVSIKNGKWIGYSTDGQGFVNGLSEIQFNPQNKKIQIIGAGGSSASIVQALLVNGVSELRMINRTHEKAKSMLEKFSVDFPQAKLSTGVFSEPFDLLVNTSTMGRDGIELACDEELVKMAGSVVDVLYDPPQTPLLKLAEKLGKKTQNGLPMLLNQGALSFEIWTGKKAPIELMKHAIENILANF